MLHAVIMAGGSGTRLWPESRAARAKQFLCFEGTRTLIGSTLDRLGRLVPAERGMVVTGRSMVELTRKSLPELPENRILGEPAARNTAPCIGWAAAKLLKEDPEATMIVLPSDHIIRPDALFCDTLQFAADLVEEDPNRLITLGIKPLFPSTSYGYIQRSEPVRSPVAEIWKKLTGAYNVVKFHEKPPVETAKQFLAAGNYGWNAGIFVWKAKTVFDLLHRFEPEMGQLLDDVFESIGTSREQSVTDQCFPMMKKISIDYAVMERAESIVMLDATFSWDDVGTWCSLDRIYADKRDSEGNLEIGTRLLAIDSKNCVVRGNDPKHLFALLGMEDLIVVQTADATLIARKDQEESVRKIIDRLKLEKREEYL